MWKNLTLALLSITLFTACGSDDKKSSAGPVAPTGPQPVVAANFPNENGTPFGRWISQGMTNENEVTLQYRLFVNRKNEVALGIQCAAEGLQASGMTMAKVKIDGNILEILELAKVEAKSADARLDCSVEFNAGKLQWQYENEVLTIAGEGGQPLNLGREQ